MRVESCGKVNLTLEVYGVRADGFHEIRSVLAPVSLSDTLDFSTCPDGRVSSDTPYGESDLIVKAARLLKGASPLGCRVHVEKRIPSGGGLGGGSANAATTLRALNRLWNLDKSLDELLALAAKIGSDVPALLLAQETGAPVLMEGRGEKVSPLPKKSLPFALASTTLVLANPRIHAATPAVYARANERTSPPSARVNDLQDAALSLYPEIGRALEAMRGCALRDVMMTGSGATVFGFAQDAAEAQAAVRSLAAQGFWAADAELLGV